MNIYIYYIYIILYILYIYIYIYISYIIFIVCLTRKAPASLQVLSRGRPQPPWNRPSAPS